MRAIALLITVCVATSSGAATAASVGHTAPAPAHQVTGPAAPRAAAGVVVGSTGPTGANFVGLAANVTTVQTAVASSSASYTVPAAGVLTSISHDEGPTGGFFRAVFFGPGSSATSFPVRGYSAKLPSLASSLNTLPVQISVPAGTILGIWIEAASMSPVKSMASAADSYSGGVVDPTTISTFNGAAPVANRQVNISAVWEPDADGDGFGDVSQDLCPQSATAHAACPVPDTTVTRAPKKSSTKRKVTITFSSTVAGSTFTCAVDTSATTPCTSPFKKKLKYGAHIVVITATSALGVADSTPAIVRFKVRKPRH